MATFGNTGNGTSNAANSADFEYGNKFTLTEPGTVTKITGRWAGGASDGKIKLCLYADSAGLPGALVANSITPEITIPASAAVANYDGILVTPVLLTAGDYWIVQHVGTSANYYFDAAGTIQYKARAYASGPIDPFGTPTGNFVDRLCQYATYTPGGPSTDIQVPLGPIVRGRFA